MKPNHIPVVLVFLLFAALLTPTTASSQATGREWPFPEFTNQRTLKAKATLGDAEMKVANQNALKYALAVIPLGELGGTLGDVEAAAVAGNGPEQFEITRTTDARIYMTRGTKAAMWYSMDIRTYPTEAVVELDPKKPVLIVYYKIDLRGGAISPKDWDKLLGEALRWKIAAEGK
jgi:hypothetical protein